MKQHRKNADIKADDLINKHESKSFCQQIDSLSPNQWNKSQ